jgi:hypothetical protein
MNLVQCAATKDNEGMALRLVEAGVSWWLPKTERRDEAGNSLYAPEMLLEASGARQMQQSLQSYVSDVDVEHH